jgi:flagellar M-ring protein FliF
VALAIALLGLLIVRPLMKRLVATPGAQGSVNSSDGLAAAGGLRGGADQALLGGAQAVDSTGPAEGEVELREGETLEELKARMKPKKKGISADLLDTANSYDDKVTVVRMLVSQDSKRVALSLKNMIGRDLS